MPKFLQWNCHSIRHKKNDIITLINKYKPSIFAVQETWLKPGSNFRIPGFSCLRDDRSDGYAGSAILVSRNVIFKQLSLPSHSNSIFAVAVRANNISFLSIYIPEPNLAILSELKTIITSLPPPILILGDFNIHHTSWGCYYCDSISFPFLDLCDELDLCLLNDGSPTRRVPPSQNPKTAVDLSLTSPSLASSLSWSVLSSTHGSDHFTIILSIPDSLHSIPTASLPPLLKFNIHRADWSQFRSHLDQEIMNIPLINPVNVLSSYLIFRNALLSSAANSIPLKNTVRCKIPSPPWWDSECTQACQSRSEAENAYSVAMSSENFISYQRIAAKTVRLLSEKKRLGWLRFCEELSPITPPSKVWKNMRRYRCSVPALVISSNDPSDWIEHFSCRLAPPSVPCLEETFPSAFSSNSTDDFESPFSWEELSAVLEGLSDSSPGIDGIPYSFISKSSNSVKRVFLSILNNIFLSGTPPDEWRTQIIIPILKPRKPSSDPSSYRPIALSCTMAKILEHLIKNRLEWIVENRNILAKSQFGFRKGFSTMDSLSIFLTDVRISFSKNESLVGVFLDISSAYDNVLLPVLRQKMLQLSIPVKIVNIIFNLLSPRFVYIRAPNYSSSPRQLWKGLPQGSVLSPLLYSIYTYDLELSVNSFCQVLQYADDLALYVSSKNIDEASSRLNSGIGYLQDWLSDHGLSLSIPKSKVVVFSRSRSCPNVSISYDQHNFSVVDNVKFLGVVLDSRLTGVHHINHIVKKCEKNINILRSLSGVWWGCHPYTQKLMYNALVRSHLDYGTFLLEPCNKSAMSSLDKLQSKCLRLICGAMKSSPINALQVECGDAPLFLRRQYLSDRFLSKVIQSPYHPLISKLHILSDFISSNKYWYHKDYPCLFNSFVSYLRLPCPVFQYQKFPLFDISFKALIFQPQVLLDLGIEKKCNSANSQLNRYIAKHWPDWLIIYTDASKLSDQGCVGSAVWIPKYNMILNFKCPPQASVFSGESIAILEALSFIESHKLNKSVILTDSKSCLQAIVANQFKSKSKFPYILKIKNLLFSCHSKNIEVVLAWLPGHSGILGNETADLCAKDATTTGCMDHYRIYSNDLLPIAKQRLLSSWNSCWQKTSFCKGKHYADIQGFIPPRPWFCNFKDLHKRVTSTICRLRLGHTCTPVHLAKLHIRDSSICECGLDEGSPNHMFFSCPRLSSSLYDLLPPDIPRPIDLKSLLSLVNSPFVYILSSFINQNNIKL